MEWASIAKSFAEGFRSAMDNTEQSIMQKTKKIQDNIVDRFYAIKRLMFRSVIELMLIAISIVFILIGVVLLIERWLSLDYVLLIVGLLVFNFVLLTGKFKR